MLRGLKQALHTPGPRDPTETDRTVFEHLLWRYRLAVICCRDRGSGFGYGISMEEVTINPTIESRDPKAGWPQAKQLKGRDQLHPSRDNWIKALLSKALPTRTRHSFPHIVPPIRKLTQASFTKGQTEEVRRITISQQLE